MTQQEVERLEQIIYSELRKYEHSPLVAHDVSQALTKRIRALTAAPTVTDADLGEIARFAGTKNDAARLTHKLTTDAAPKATEGAAMELARMVIELHGAFIHDSSCPMCRIVTAARALLASPIAPSTEQKP